MSINHTPIKVENFGGLFNRGYDVECPVNHFSDGQNFSFYGAVVGTRWGARKDFTISNVKRIRTYRRTGEAARLLILVYTAGSGKIYDSTNLAAPVLTVTGMVDFSVANVFNRAFITPHNGVTGLPGEKVYIYNGTTARAACGAAPVGVPTITNSGTAGSVEVGQHLVGWAFETDTGFITPPTTPVLVTTPGSQKIHCTNIPIGGTEVVARRAVATQVITYNGNPVGFNLFFVPGGRIGDNVTTVFDIDFFDSQLIASADYLLDELTEIPAGVGITNYGSRLVVFGENSNPSVCRVGNIAEPESFSSTSGFLVVDPTEIGGITNAIEFRSSLYLLKGTHTYATTDNGSDADTWTVSSIDKGVGTVSPFGVSELLDNKGANLDFFLVASINGLQVFNGIYTDKPLTYKVQKFWDRVNKNAFSTVQVEQDTDAKVVYVSVPLDENVTPNAVLVGNYAQGMNYQDIRWSLYRFPWSAQSITVNVNSATKTAFFQIAGTDNIYSLIENQLTDNGTSIDTWIKTAYVYLKQWLNFIQQFWSIKGNFWGSGTLTVTAYSVRDVVSVNGPSVTLSDPSAFEQESRFNLQNERCAVKLRTNNTTDWWRTNEFTIFAKKLWRNRPQ
jgi:hypothetical protein